MTVRSISLALLLLGLASAASAEDADRPAGAEMPPPNWSGLYVGLHGGYGGSTTHWGFPFDEYYNFVPGEGFSTDPEGGIVGGHLTLSRQFGRFVVGVEGAFSKTTLSADRVGAVSALYPEDRFTVGIDDLATVSGRLGYAVENWLVYAKGGYAAAEVSHHALSGPPGAGVVARERSSQAGGVIGGGFEYMITPQIVFGLDYQYVKLDAERHATTTTGTLPGMPVTIDADDIALHAITARLSIKLGADWHRSEVWK